MPPQREDLNEDDHDRLLTVCRDVKWIRDAMERHLDRHWRITVLVAGSVVASAAALVVEVARNIAK